MSKTPKYPVVRKEWPRIRDLRSSSMNSFMVDPRPHSRREYFVKLAEAKTRADQLATERLNRGTEALSFSTENRVMAVECLEKLRPFGKSLREAVDHFVTWLKDEQAKQESLLVSECLFQYQIARQADHDRKELAHRSLQEIKQWVKRLTVAFGSRHIAEVTPDAVETYLNSFPGSARTRVNVRLRMSTFFNFCKTKGWIAQNPCESVSVSAKRTDTQILTVDAAERLLAAARASDFCDVVVPYAAICLFAGLRPGEAEQLDWAQVHFDTGAIEVLAHTSKTRDSRFVKMEPILITWLTPYAKKSGLVIGKNFRKKWDPVRVAAGYDHKNGGVKWIADVMRHSYASYWLALHNNRAELAELMGNSVDVIKAHYRRPILQSQAEAYWSILPSKV